MIDSTAIGEIIRTYAKHGWILRRVLLTSKLRNALVVNIGELFGDVTITDCDCDCDIDAAWFSRPPANGEIAWEIRNLSETPFALLEYLDETADDFERSLHIVETRLAETVSAKRNA
jgi:hypothetical protein